MVPIGSIGKRRGVLGEPVIRPVEGCWGEAIPNNPIQRHDLLRRANRGVGTGGRLSIECPRDMPTPLGYQEGRDNPGKAQSQALYVPAIPWGPPPQGVWGATGITTLAPHAPPQHASGDPRVPPGPTCPPPIRGVARGALRGCLPSPQGLGQGIPARA